LLTPPLDGTILPGVTRDSIITLMNEAKDIKVKVRSLKIQELVKAVNENRVYEAFGAGTAAVVSPIKSFYYEGNTYDIPIDQETGAG